jgi:hypothetical protein
MKNVIFKIGMLISLFYMVSCSKSTDPNAPRPITENYFSYLGNAYQVNPAYGGAWLRDLNVLTTRSREDISLIIRFKDRPTVDGEYSVRSASPNDPAGFKDNECSISIISTGAPAFLASTGRQGNRVKITVVNGKLRADFTYIELAFQEGSGAKTTTLTGNFKEK